MKIKISKIGAAKSQLLEAINLFFEGRDPVSIHTLVGAALEILNDHFNAKEVRDSNLVLHKDSIHIKDEYRKEWKDSINKFKNFFKHADRDLKQGVREIEFSPDINEIFILEAIHRLQGVEKDKDVHEPEFKVFIAWMMKMRPGLFKEDQKQNVEKIGELELNSLQDFRNSLLYLKGRIGI